MRTGTLASLLLFPLAALAVPFALASGSHRSTSDSVAVIFFCFGLALPASTRAQAMSATCAAPTSQVGIDHIVLAVTALEDASDTYARLGFAQKPGRAHANGLKNGHLEFADGTELELMTVVGEVGDGVARSYEAFLEGGEGGAFLALKGSREAVLAAASRAGIASALLRAGGFRYVTFPERGLENVFFVEHGPDAQDPDSRVRHRNGSLGVESVWLEASPRLGKLLSALGATECGSTALPDGRLGAGYGVAGGSVVVTSPPGDLRPRVIGVTLRAAESASLPLLGPEETHGIWLGWRPQRGPGPSSSVSRGYR